jgi:hypothetical protein
MSHARKSIAVLCIAVVVVAALLPAVSIDLVAILTPLWLVVPAVAVVSIRRIALCNNEQPVSLLSLVPSRAPPATTSA